MESENLNVNEAGEKARNFLEEIIERDVKSGKHNGRVLTRFPPEPNGYLHIGHAKSICLNFGLAKKFGGKTNLRFDDTNPTKEDVEYVDSIKEDIKWLGFKHAEIGIDDLVAIAAATRCHEHKLVGRTESKLAPKRVPISPAR